MTITWDGALFTQVDVRETENTQNAVPRYLVQATEPASPINGDLWYDTVNATLKVFSGTT